MAPILTATAGRRACLAGAASLLLGGRARAAVPTDRWQLFRDRFIGRDGAELGRVIDTDNGRVSHSEGQGYGMLFATHFGDLVTFESLWRWTRTHLARPHDALLAWRYLPGAAVKVPDSNNATDGDLMIAYALARAGQIWGRPDFTRQAAAIATDILRLLVREAAGRLVLLPGQTGFDLGHAVIVNPSYYAFTAFEALDQVAPSPLWDVLARDGDEILNAGRFGRWQLPSDWLCLARADGVVAPAPGRPPRFSFDAIRVPLHLAWSGRAGSAAASGIAAWWRAASAASPPAWIDLVTGEEAPYPASAGALAVRDLLLARSGDGGPAPPSGRRLPLGYFAASLMLLAEMAQAGPTNVARSAPAPWSMANRTASRTGHDAT